MADMALEGVRVVDLTHFIAGPYCTKLMADYGAEVIKVEPPWGEVSRRFGPFPGDIPDPERSGIFLFLNTDKKGITLNLKTEKGKALLKDLVRDADILVESYEPRVLPSLRLDYKTLRQVNPRLVMTSISNFGQSGPYRNYKATEIVEAALGGNMSLSGDYEREPIKHGISLSQFFAGLNALIASLAAIYVQRSDAIGQHIDVSIMESVAASIPYAINQYTYLGAIWRRAPKNRPVFGMDLWPCKDGHIGMSVIRSTDMADVAAFLEEPALEDPKYATAEGRVKYSHEIEQLVLKKYLDWNKREFFNRAHEWRFMASMEILPTELVECEQLQAREYFRPLTHPKAGTLPYPGEVMGLTETPVQLRSAAPLLGQHNEEVFCGRLGYSRQELSQLRQMGVI
ncbi:MAG: CoA transferase [Chloroflexi bacterium]|nr:CoA transferase [Chloroflexota bacterium]